MALLLDKLILWSIVIINIIVCKPRRSFMKQFSFYFFLTLLAFSCTTFSMDLTLAREINGDQDGKEEAIVEALLGENLDQADEENVVEADQELVQGQTELVVHIEREDATEELSSRNCPPTLLFDTAFVALALTGCGIAFWRLVVHGLHQ